MKNLTILFVLIISINSCTAQWGKKIKGNGTITTIKKSVGDYDSLDMAGLFDVKFVDVKELKTSISGSGDIELTGSTDIFDLSISGSGDIDAFRLAANNVEVSVSGSGDIDVTANKSIKARVSGSGDITYKGNPEKIDTKSSGSGDISKG